MNQLKFRGVSISTGLMVFGGGVDTERDTPIIINNGKRVFVKAGTIDQFVCVKDDLEKDLYTNDIVCISGSGNCIVGISPTHGVTYTCIADDAMSTCAHDVLAEQENIFLVGNIHENPELLEVTKL